MPLLASCWVWVLPCLRKNQQSRKRDYIIAELVGTLFIDMLKMVMIPLVFTSIAVGVANLRAHRQMHRVWKATLGFFMFSMALAIILGLTAANLFRPGEGLQLAMFQDRHAGVSSRADAAVRFFCTTAAFACFRTRLQHWLRVMCWR